MKKRQLFRSLGALALGLVLTAAQPGVLYAREWDEELVAEDVPAEEDFLYEAEPFEAEEEEALPWEEESFLPEAELIEAAEEAGAFEAEDLGFVSEDGFTASLTAAEGQYVLMNIPYDKFYEAELAEGSAAVDAVTSATKNKPRTGTLAGGSFHVDPEGTDITGVIYPVLVKDSSLLAGCTEVTEENKVDITVTNRGQTSTTTYSGKDALFESPAYSYYRLSEAPACYKELLAQGSFSAAVGEPKTLEGASGTVIYDDHHADIVISLTLPEGGVAQGDAVSGVVVTDENGATYGLRHIANIWRTTQLGFSIGELDLLGKTITKVRYYTQDQVYDYPVSIKIGTPAYALMNIPYDKFYEAELAEGSAAVDAVTSATKNKPRTGGLAGGSFHVDPEGTDISGVIYPVLVEDPALLAGLTQVTEESKVDITVTNRGQTSTTTYSGKDALFESPAYSYYLLTEKPAKFKTATLDESGWHFGRVGGRATTLEGATGTVVYDDHHADIVISLTLPEGGVAQGDAVSGVVVTDENGATYGLRHIANIWRTTQLGFSIGELDLLGKTITKVRYYTQDQVYDYPVSIKIGTPTYALMNIPYDKFYEAELAEGSAAVDAVTSATKNKPRTGGLAGGSFHVDPEGMDISGVIYPVLVEDPALLAGLTQVTEESKVDITVTNRGQTSTTTYSGKDALFESPAYSYYLLTEKPAKFKTATLDESGWHFGRVGGRAASLEGASAEVAFDDHHADVVITLTLPEGGVVQGDAVSGVVVTEESGATYGLRHIANIWRTTQLGFNKGDLDLLGKTVTNVRYYTQDQVYDYPVSFHIHKLVKVEAAEATYQAEGVKEHYACEVCGELFADETAKEPLTKEEVTIPRLTEKPGTVAEVDTSAKVEKGVLKVRFSAVEGATDYEAAYRLAGEEEFQTVKSGGKLKVNLKGLEEGAKVEVKVRALIDAGDQMIEGDYSKTVRRWMVRPSVSVEEKKAGPRLSFGVEGAVSYRIKVAENAEMKDFRLIGRRKTFKTLKDLSEGKTAYVKVIAYTKAEGKTYVGAWSEKTELKR